MCCSLVMSAKDKRNSETVSDKFDFKKALQEKIKERSVDSPYARQESNGRIMCIPCGLPVKSAIVWQAHILKQSHLDMVVRYHELQKQKNNPTYITSSVPSITPLKGILKNKTSFEGDVNEEDSLPPVKKLKVKEEDPPRTKSGLPADFFDSDKSKGAQIKAKKDQDNKVNSKSESNVISHKGAASETLPEGFFDDPVADAKARHVEYKDKDEEEWAAFMREVSAAEAQSQQIIEEDKEESALVTQMEQADEQLKHLERIVELDRRKSIKRQDEEEQMDMDELDEVSSEEEFSPVLWRTKDSHI